MKTKSFFTIILIFICLNTNAQWLQVYNSGTVESITANDSLIVADHLGAVLISNGNDNIWNEVYPCPLCYDIYPTLAICGTSIFAATLEVLAITEIA